MSKEDTIAGILERSNPRLFYSNENLHIYECVINLGNLTANLNL